MTKEIAPLINPKYSFSGESCGGVLNKIFANETSALNGFGNWAFGTVNAVEKLTCRTDISQLTLLSWKKVIFNQKLLKQQRAWCSFCFRESIDNSQILYEPLSWSLEVLKLCPTHKTPLYNICPHCEKGNRPLSWYSKPGFCAKCRGWLGVDAYTYKLPNLKFKAVEDDEQLHCIKCVNDLLGMSPDSFSDKAKVFIASHLDHFVEDISRGASLHLAQVLGADVTQVRKWRKGQITPTLASLINICYKLQIDFPTLLKPVYSEIIDKIYESKKKHKESSEKPVFYGPIKKATQKQKLVISVLETALLENPPPSVDDIATRLKYRNSSSLYALAPEIFKRVRQRYKVFLKEQQSKSIREVLERVLSEYPPKSLENVASELGVRSHTLRSYERSLCKQVSSNYSRFRTQKKDERVEILFEEMKQIAQSLYNKGIIPTPSRISLHMSSPGSILRLESRKKLEQFLQENEWF